MEKEKTWQSHLFLPDKHVLFLCVDDWTDGIPSGRILNACFADEVSFTGFGDMLLTIEQLCDRLNLTQSCMQLRHGPNRKNHLDNKTEWNDVRHAETPTGASDALFSRFGHARVFPVRIQYRMHATWQGVVQLHNEAVPFRSALELLGLLDDALWAQEKTDKRIFDHAKAQTGGEEPAEKTE